MRRVHVRSVALLPAVLPNGIVRGLVRVGSTLYIGGDQMTRVAGQVRDGPAAFDTATASRRSP